MKLITIYFNNNITIYTCIFRCFEILITFVEFGLFIGVELLSAKSVWVLNMPVDLSFFSDPIVICDI